MYFGEIKMITIIRNHLILLGLSILLIACATVTQETVGANNKKVYGIDCSGKAVSINTCYKKAAQLCPMGYTLVSNDAPTVPSIDTPIHEISDAIAYSIPGVKKGITVKCQ